jgi:hypothetical protein
MIPASTPADAHGRRAALRRLAAFLITCAIDGTTIGYGKKAQRPVCVNLSALSSADSKRRKLDNYTEKSADPTKTCGGCVFFSPGADGATCGQCQIFNGPANPNGRCDDWTARPA